MVPASGPAPTTAQVRAMLRDYLQAEFPSAPARQAEALALFDDPDLIAKIPNPSLRAGLVGLMGTSGEPAIDFILNAETSAGLPKVNIVDFDGLPWDPSDTGTARSLVSPETGQASFVFNPKYTFENPFAFSSILAHEALHSDTVVKDTEEVIALTLHSYVYLEQLITHPELALADAELTRRSNRNALTRRTPAPTASSNCSRPRATRPFFPAAPFPSPVGLSSFRQTWTWSTPRATRSCVPTSPTSPSRAAWCRPARIFDFDTLDFIDQNSGGIEAALQSARGLRVFEALGLANVAAGGPPPIG